jgi:hypothetical protein
MPAGKTCMPSPRRSLVSVSLERALNPRRNADQDAIRWVLLGQPNNFEGRQRVGWRDG